MEHEIPLGRELKIANVIAQRQHLERQLKKASSPLRDVSVQFIGHIFSENITWLKEMHDIDVFTTRITDGEEYGKEMNILTPSDDITLSDKEMEISLKILEQSMAKKFPCQNCISGNCIECVGELGNLIRELYPCAYNDDACVCDENGEEPNEV